MTLARSFVLVIVAALASRIAVADDPCDAGYSCQYVQIQPNVGDVQFDLRPLCRPEAPYAATDAAANTTVMFNVCGEVTAPCFPAKYSALPVDRPMGVQYWGDTPSCATKDCTDPATGDKVCCTADCSIIGAGVPVWTMRDPSNPGTGGVNLAHGVLPSAAGDAHPCDVDPATGQPGLHSLIFTLECDPHGESGVLMIKGMTSNSSTCVTEIVMSTLNACGCVPECVNKNCGDDGCGGFCSSTQGQCPEPYLCGPDGVCCLSQCGATGGWECGNSCGNSCGTCSNGTSCVFGHCVASPSPSPSRSPSTSLSATPSVSGSPTISKTPKASPISQSASPPPSCSPAAHSKSIVGPVGGAFAGGVVTALVLGGLTMFWYKRKSRDLSLLSHNPPPSSSAFGSM